MRTIERVQTGVRIEKRLLKVLKGLAEHADLSLGDLIEGPLMHRRMVGRQPLTSEFLDAIAAIAYRVMTAAETRR